MSFVDAGQYLCVDLHPQLCSVHEGNHVILTPQFCTRVSLTLLENSQGLNLIDCKIPMKPGLEGEVAAYRYFHQKTKD